jgi:hypothetical protein
MMPSAVTVGLQDDNGTPLKYDWAPDGSMLIWRNATQQNRHVDVESIEFHYRLIGTDVYDDEDKAPPTAQASIDAASVAIVTKLAELEKAFVKGTGLIVTAITIACAVLYFARH